MFAASDSDRNKVVLIPELLQSRREDEYLVLQLFLMGQAMTIDFTHDSETSLPITWSKRTNNFVFNAIIRSSFMDNSAYNRNRSKSTSNGLTLLRLAQEILTY